ncbi:LON peptidase substrate-binding domain-containing protein [Homoserinibacter sp. YIM 151385]|uniref:LON peptidase substrate-binding domain-containing protein n=1 Tax=Homoserinibacter sp. YIM 151385 TaxID=2985506 RepID=UPI0022F002C0|nr:LON peptidase substrate-binding domain-containing protein [Homoserinibacter sp. YIM 151385]WBU38106.1 LON peptidase substrate-binding domain-containing protein [Homoserinibacter sp. YIM 151385]
MTEPIAMFPLGAVLFPSMPLAVRVFEERYLAMLAEVLPLDPPEFGVVLIERGREVGGGDARFGVGTVARISELETGEGFVALLGVGTRRVEVVDWLVDDPYPRAVVRELGPLAWDEAHRELLVATERTVRAALAVASEYRELPFAPDIPIADEPVAAAWQLAAIAPLGQLDQVRLLGSTSVQELLERTAEATTAAVEQIAFSWDDDADAAEAGDGEPGGPVEP